MVLLFLGLILFVAVVAYVLVLLFRPSWLGERRRQPIAKDPEGVIPPTQLRPFRAVLPGVVLKT